jgi:nicotinamide riboside kinase
MYRVGFVGVPGVGKTSTARALAAFCRKVETFKKVELIAEYARRFIAKYGTETLTLSDQFRIMEKQLEWEDVIPEDSTDMLITDSPVHMGFIYALDLRRKDNQKDTMYMNDIFKRLNKINFPTRYDYIFHLPPVLNPVEDGIRITKHFDPVWREEADRRILNVFDLFPPKKFVTIESENLMDRVDECLSYLKSIEYAKEKK